MKLTDTRTRALRAIADGGVRAFFTSRGHSVLTMPVGIHRPAIEWLMKNGLAQQTALKFGGTHATVNITDAGRAALQHEAPKP